jgi:hypothetical protein
VEAARGNGDALLLCSAEPEVSLRRFRGHLNTAIMVAGGEVDVEENAKGTEIVHG